MNCKHDIRFELLARLCPNSTGKEYSCEVSCLLFLTCSALSCFDIVLLKRAILRFLWVLFTGADIRSVCTEAGMYAIRARRKTVTEKDFLDAVNKVIKGYQKFSATPKYMAYN